MLYYWHYGYAVGWGTLALINVGLSQTQDRGGLKWFILSVLFVPLATLLLVLTYEKPV